MSKRKLKKCNTYGCQNKADPHSLDSHCLVCIDESWHQHYLGQVRKSEADLKRRVRRLEETKEE